MNFANVTSLTIPEGNVKAIYCNDVKLWGVGGTYENTITGVPPLTLANCTGDDLVSWSIVGNTIQDGTPSPENPIDVLGTGDWDDTEQKYKIPVVSRGKNLFDKDNVNVINGYITSSTFKIVANNSTRTIYIKCKPNTKYTVSKVLSKRFNVAYTTETPQINVTVYGIVQDFNAEHLTITTGVDAKYLCMFMYHASYDTLTYDEIINTIQIESGSTPTPYEPYTEPTTTNIYIDSPLMSGETMSSDGTITRASGETETFTPPSIPTQSATTVLDTDCVVAPSEMTVTFMSTTPQNEETR